MSGPGATRVPLGDVPAGVAIVVRERQPIAAARRECTRRRTDAYVPGRDGVVPRALPPLAIFQLAPSALTTRPMFATVHRSLHRAGPNTDGAEKKRGHRTSVSERAS